ncbi:hypothetical protein ACTI_49500 [Actinoplanes sp. OR16]|nr:hypothetical protein ACTI_49500 [Actinoplanes sp. OR16]
MGRAAEQARIRQAIGDAGAGRPHLVVLHGEPGAGKTTLLRYALAAARDNGFHTVATTGAVASLLQALEIEATPDPLTLRLAVLDAISRRCRTGPVMIAVDDLPGPQADVVALLSFLFRRLRGERLLIVCATRVPHAFAAAGVPLTSCPVPPLTPDAAAALLDGLPGAPTGPARAEILRHCGGNPQGLITLAGYVADTGDPRTELQIDDTDDLVRVFAPALPDLPASTRRVLLFAAAAQDDSLSGVLRAAGPGSPTAVPPRTPG